MTDHINNYNWAESIACMIAGRVGEDEKKGRECWIYTAGFSTELLVPYNGLFSGVQMFSDVA